jgi:predicted metal-dependent phosphoesterase TrpH
LIKADLHVHTCYSEDSISPPEKVVKQCLKIGINCLAVTDHNTIEGALEVKRIAPFKIIVGEEVLTTQGEIIGLFLKEEIPGRLSPEETVARIKAQGGLVCIPHCFDRFRRSSTLQRRALEKIMPDVDIIEVFNSRTMLLRDSARALGFAQKLGLLVAAGSDAHVISEIGKSFVELPEFNDTEQFKQALRRGQVFGRRTNPLIHFYGIRDRVLKRFQRS